MKSYPSIIGATDSVLSSPFMFAFSMLPILQIPAVWRRLIITMSLMTELVIN